MSFLIPVDNLARLEEAIRNVRVHRPTNVLLLSQRKPEESVHETLAAFRLPEYVTELTISLGHAPAQNVLEAIIKLIMSGPSSLEIHNWPKALDGPLFDALLDKTDLSKLWIFAEMNLRPMVRLATTLRSLKLSFAEESNEDWSELGNAIATSSTLIELSLLYRVPKTAFPRHLPVNLLVFEVRSVWTIAFDWLGHGYWPIKLERLDLYHHEALKLHELTEVMKTRLRSVQVLTLAETEQVTPLSDILSGKNRIDDLSLVHHGALDPLVQVLTSPFALMSSLTITHGLGEADTKKLWATIRGKTRASCWKLLGNHQEWQVIRNEWFQVMQTLLSIHELPKLRRRSLAGLVPWRDHILRIVNTLGWPLADYCEEGYEALFDPNDELDL